MTIRTRLLVVAIVPAVALAVTNVLLRTSAPASKVTLATALTAAGMVVALVLAMIVANTITKPLRRLGEAAERASHLQTLVDALRRPGGGDKDLALTPVGLPRGGEIGHVASAFDEFQGAAARLAVGQAALLNKTVAEKGTIEVFVNLARRMQGLVDHQIEFLDGLEAEEQDPDTLENLFRLDQLATRVRRNAESLLTLAGAASARSWERPLAMSDVIRAGMAEVEDIGRVDLLVDDNAAMVGNVAADAAHLLSELLENATRWSPPHTRVEVSGTPAAGGYAITIEDSGIGMPVDALAEANHILTGPPLAEATVARSLGLVVAGRLARRLGIVVRLAPGSSGGILAKVLVPPALMVAPDETAGLEGVGVGTARALPFALARQEKRARISSQRSRGRRPLPGQQTEATITHLPEPRRVDPPAMPAPAAPEPVEREARWTEPAPPVEPEWPAADAGSRWSDAPAAHAQEPEWPASATAWTRSDADGPAPAVEPEPEWLAAREDWSPAAQPSWTPVEPEWPVPAADGGWADPGPAATEQVPAVDRWTEPSTPPAPVWEPVSAAETGPSSAPVPPAQSPAAAWEPAEPAPAAWSPAEAAPASAPAAEPAWSPAVSEPAPAPAAEDPSAAPSRLRPEPQWTPAVEATPARAAEPERPIGPLAPVRPVRQPTTAEGATLPVRTRSTPAPDPAVTAAAPDPAVAAATPAVAPPAARREPLAPGTPPPPAAPDGPAPSAAEPPAAIRPTPAVRPARFAAASSRPLAGAAPPVPPAPADAKEDEYRRHLERATAAGLVRRVPKASLPKDTGGAGKRVPKTGGGDPAPERLPDEVRSLLSSYRSGVQRGRSDGPDADQRTTTPQEQP
ncbi:MAG TPA: ATP-binding protein [Acidimicrobiales bacterium]|nr:ATP-binding protein [Acidimicrobiales bacterium]